MKKSNNPSSSNCVLAVDVGNTRTKLGVVDVQKYTCIASTTLPTTGIGSRLLTSVNDLAASSAVSASKVAVLVSVVRSAGTKAAQILHSAGYTVRHLKPTASLPMKFAYSSPRKLGADRIANALCGITLFPGRVLVIVSAGTAVTIDYIGEGIFCGGAILPGVGLQMQSLHRYTDALPLVKTNAVDVPSLPGASTEHCILGGVIRGTAAAISDIVSGYCRQAAPRRPLILATGGDWQLLSRLIDFNHRTIPDLTLIGAACFLKY